MNSKAYVGLRVLLVAVACVLGRRAFANDSLERPKIIVLGFDGLDATLTKRWMDDGSLANLSRLAARGSFSPCATTNPAISPVSWASLVTSLNPGKMHIDDFVRRTFNPTNGNPGPALEGSRRIMVDAKDLGKYVSLRPHEAAVMWAVSPSNRGEASALVAIAFFVVLFLFLGSTLGALPIAVLAVGIGVATDFALGLFPERYPVTESEMRGERFWDVLARNGVRFTGTQVPGAYPAKAEPGARVLTGLFTPDVQGGPGAWSIYTNDEFARSEPEYTETGGMKYRILADSHGEFESSLRGAEDFVARDRIDRDLKRSSEEVRRLEELLPDAKSSDEQARLQASIDREKDRHEDLEIRREGGFGGRRSASVSMRIRPDFEKRRATITIDGRSQEVIEGEWSDYFPVRFRLSGGESVDAIPAVYVSKCSIDADGVPRLVLFVPPISISPKDPPVYVPLSSPRDFVSDLANDIGLFETIGWASWTNALKDGEIDDACFLSGIRRTLTWRTKQLEHELARHDFDVLFHVESIPDRVAHMVYRFLDPQHPMYDAHTSDGRKVRDLPIDLFGRQGRIQDALHATYVEVDRIVGSVLDRIDAGEFGANATLIVVSDHGFASFRSGVNLNEWLLRSGYLVTTGEPSFGISMDGIDWSKTRAYSLGLGKIYLNLEGREPHGIVAPAEAAKWKAEIQQRLEAFTDPRQGHAGVHPILRVYDASKIYSGPFVAEGPDLIVGFDRGYRVSWQTALGGLEPDTRGDFGVGSNPSPWSGDHCSVDPSLVKGVFFSNRKRTTASEPSVLDIAPTILTLCGVARPEEWDGTPIQLR